MSQQVKWHFSSPKVEEPASFIQNPVRNILRWWRFLYEGLSPNYLCIKNNVKLKNCTVFWLHGKASDLEHSHPLCADFIMLKWWNFQRKDFCNILHLLMCLIILPLHSQILQLITVVKAEWPRPGFNRQWDERQCCYRRNRWVTAAGKKSWRNNRPDTRSMNHVCSYYTHTRLVLFKNGGTLM